MSELAVSIQNLSKRYKIGRQRAKGDGLRHAIESAVRAPLAWVRSRRDQPSPEVDFWALRGVSFDIKQGEVVGVIGRNGAGKSTLLKTLSRITAPTEGRIRIFGRIASLLEVGTGFHPELTGRENIFLNGAILGMARAEIVRKFDEIVEFSEIAEFLDTPVKRYSSGMYVRLAFAVAAHLEPEILIVDEVLAVGDATFQKKCLGKIGSFAKSGRTVLFVSHNMEAVRRLCHRSVWLRDGQLYKDGPADQIANEYFAASAELSTCQVNPGFGLSISRVILKDGQGKECQQFRPGQELRVEIHYDAQRRIEQPYFILGVLGINGSCFTANMLLDGQRPKVLFGSGCVTCCFKSLPLLPQSYSVKMSVRTKSDEMIVSYQEVGYFNVVGDLAGYGYVGEFVSRASNSTSVVTPYEWRLPDGTVAPISLELSKEHCGGLSIPETWQEAVAAK